MITAGNLAGTFPGSVEATTPGTFEPSSEGSRSILYQLVPGTGPTLNAPGGVSGYFDFAGDGVLTFTAGPPPVRILALRVQADRVRVEFRSLPSVSYRLRSTDAGGLTTGVSEWNSGVEVVAGDGGVLAPPAMPSASTQFYAVEVLP